MSGRGPGVGAGHGGWTWHRSHALRNLLSRLMSAPGKNARLRRGGGEAGGRAGGRERPSEGKRRALPFRPCRLFCECCDWFEEKPIKPFRPCTFLCSFHGVEGPLFAPRCCLMRVSCRPDAPVCSVNHPRKKKSIK